MIVELELGNEVNSLNYIVSKRDLIQEGEREEHYLVRSMFAYF
jgi:hypothetical protein